MIKKLFITFFCISILFFSTSSLAQFYVRPRLGAVLPTSGDSTSYSYGAVLGYQWTNFFATEATYAHIVVPDNGNDEDEVVGEAVVFLPTPLVTPYAIGGVGALYQNDWKSMIVMGAGVQTEPLWIFVLNGGVQYSIVKDGTDFFEPVVAIGFAF